MRAEWIVARLGHRLIESEDRQSHLSASSQSQSDGDLDTPEARAYNRAKRWIEINSLALSLVLLIALLVTGWSSSLRDLAIRFAGDSYPLQLVYYVLFLCLINKVLGMGLDLRAFRLEHRFNLATQKLGSWLRDELKGWLLGTALAVILAQIIYGLMRVSPQYSFQRWWVPPWWILGWLVFMALFIFLAQLAPVVLFPLFYKFVPLRDEELKERLVRLGERAGTRVRGVYEWKLSEKTKKANAALTGLGSTRRIILADTLLENLSRDEIEAVLAHELGHHVHRHILKGIVVQAIVTLVGFWAANAALEYATYERRMFQHLTDFANLPLLVLVSSLLSFLLMPALNAYSRFAERQADRYCWKSVPSVTPYVTAMEKLNQRNLGESRPSRLVEILFHSHPPMSKRIAAAQRWARKHQASLAT